MLRGKGAELRAMLYGGGIRQLSGPLSFVASAGKHSFLHVKNGFFSAGGAQESFCISVRTCHVAHQALGLQHLLYH